MKSLLILFFLIPRNASAEEKNRWPEYVTRMQAIEKMDGAPAVRTALLALERDMKKTLDQVLPKNPQGDEAMDRELDLRYLLELWSAVFRASADQSRCADLLAEKKFDATIGMPEGQVRKDYRGPLKTLEKICNK